MLKQTLQIRRDSFTSESLSSNQSETTQSPIYSSVEESVKMESNEPNDRAVSLLSTEILSKKPSISSKKKQISKKSSRNLKRSGSSLNHMSCRNGRSSRSSAHGKDLSKRSNHDDNEKSKNTPQNDEPTIGHIKRDEDDHHAVTLILSLNDSFSIKQDMCLNCGSFGKSNEGQLISCSQCGQCFHSYCAGLSNMCDVMTERGWRCLDCTVCEGCGKATDEGRLLLCDDCDISYHIYCLNPPLDQVPKGNWKCKWCVKCVKCGSRTPGNKCEWKNNYTECGICYSLSLCHVCNSEYKENDTIIRCLTCERYSHANCKIQLSEIEVEKRFSGGFTCTHCNEENLALSKKLNLRNDYQNDQFLEEISNLSKKGFLDEGIYLTEIGSDLIKKIKIKPSPSVRRNRAPKLPIVSEPSDLHHHHNKQADKHLDEASRSSSEDKADAHHHEEIISDFKPVELKAKAKRQVNIGMGGFNPKSRSRTKANVNEHDAESEVKTANKRKKKSTCEEMIPVYMQEAFFGAHVLTAPNKELIDLNIDPSQTDLLAQQQTKYKNSMTMNHKINLDEDTLKMAQQSKRENFELGIEDFLDGDIVSYLFNENRNLMEFNPDQELSSSNRMRTKEDEKMFDDIFQHIASEQQNQQQQHASKNSNPSSVDDYLNMHEQLNEHEPSSHLSNQSQLLHSHSNHHNHHNQQEQPQQSELTTSVDSKNIDDLVRQFKESTHRYSHEQMAKSQQHLHHQQQQQQQQQIHMNKPQENKSTFAANDIISNIFVNNAIPNNSQPVEMTAQQLQQPHHQQPSQQMHVPHMQPVYQMYPNVKINQQNTANHVSQFLNEKIETNSMINASIVADERDKSQSNHESQLGFEDPECSNDGFKEPQSEVTGLNAKEELSRQQKTLEKYAEDEELGEFATQAMPLYANTHFPNLKNEMKDLNERYKYINKLWKKLDSQVKNNFINKSRHNRYKKKSDEKASTNSKAKRVKSPSCSSDKQSEADTYSRSATPSVSLDDASNASQLTHKLFDDKPPQHQHQQNTTPSQFAFFPPLDQQQQLQQQQLQKQNMINNMNIQGATFSQPSNHSIQNLLDKSQQPTSIFVTSINNNQQATMINQLNNANHMFQMNGQPILIANQAHFAYVHQSQQPLHQPIETMNKTSAQNEMDSHMDDIINAVANGAGTVASYEDIEDDLVQDEESRSSFLTDENTNQSKSETKKPTKRKQKKSDEPPKSQPTSQNQQQQQQDQSMLEPYAKAAMIHGVNEINATHHSFSVNANHIANSFNQPNNNQMMTQTHSIDQFALNNNNGQITYMDNNNSHVFNKIICKDDNLKKMLSCNDGTAMLSGLNIKKNILENNSSEENKMMNFAANSTTTVTNTNQLERFLQLDGTSDDANETISASTLNIATPILNSNASESVNLSSKMGIIYPANIANNVMINSSCLQPNFFIASSTNGQPQQQQQQQQQAHSQASISAVPTSSQPTMATQGHQNNSSAVKLNQKVVLNHELLNRYGVSLNNSTPQPLILVSSANLIDSSKTSLNKPNQILPSAIEANSSSNKLIIMENVKRETEHEHLPSENGIKKENGDNEPIKMDNLTSTNAKTMMIVDSNVINQIQMAPKLNGDNTLLKALLNTAPKNATSTQPVTPIDHQQIEQQATIDNKMNGALNGNPDLVHAVNSVVNTTQTKIEVQDDKQIQQQQQQQPAAKKSNTGISRKQKANPNKQQTQQPQQMTQQSKLMNDLKNKIELNQLQIGQTVQINEHDINNSLEKQDSTVTINSPNESNKQRSKPRAKTVKTTVDTSSSASTAQSQVNLLTPNAHLNQNGVSFVDPLVQRLFADLKAMGSLKMCQPKSDYNQVETNYPEKKHSMIVRNSVHLKGNMFELLTANIFNKYEKDKRFFEYFTNYKGAFVKSSDEVTLLRNAFRISTATLHSPIVEHGVESINDSNKRLNDLLLANNRPNNTDWNNESGKKENKNEENNEPAATNDYKEYLKKVLNKDLKTNSLDNQDDAKSPIIDIEMHDAQTPSPLVSTAAKITTTNEHVSESHFAIPLSTTTNLNPKLVSTTFRLTNKASANLKNVVTKLSTLLQMDTPSEFKLGKLVVVKQEPSKAHVQNETKTNMSTTNQSETAYTIQSLMNSSSLKTCKFCDSFLINENPSMAENNKENHELKYNYQFCSEYCKTSYQKLLIIKRTNFKSVRFNLFDNETVNDKRKSIESTSQQEKLVFKWTPALFTTLRATAKRTSEEQTPKTDNKFEVIRLSNPIDKRVCIFCQTCGDQEANGPSRLLTVDMDKWAHLNCALWSDDVYETMAGALINVDIAYKKSANVECNFCHQKGATLRCFSPKCTYAYHLPCALKDKCAFVQDKTVFCSIHANKIVPENRLNDLSVHRNVWVQRDEIAQIQSYISRDYDEDYYAIRIGTLILHNIGQLLPHQLNSCNFHTRDCIYPIGYKTTRFYWSMNKCFRRCRYVCCINEREDGKPEFTVTVVEDGAERETLVDSTPTAVWLRILERIENLRKLNDVVKLFPVYFSGEYMFGLTEPHIIRLVESLPGIETLPDYAFKNGRLQLLDMPLTINPTGCARSEPKLRTHFRKSSKLMCNNSSQSATTSSSSTSTSTSTTSSNVNQSSSNQLSQYELDDDEMDEDDRFDDMNIQSSVSYTKQFVLSKSAQIRKLKTDWRSNVYLAKSSIQGLGLYAAKDLEKNTMIIEYIGDLIRNEVANRREKLYQEQNRGIYMFRLNDDTVIDATITGGLARYVNHCCDPNCIAETISLEKEQKIVIIANKKILKGEELTYDYKFDFEDGGDKIQCLCGSANCKKWMN